MQRPELINFCLTPFLKDCGSVSVCADGYCPSNLASTSMLAREKGFRVEHFIRPPVQLEFYFAAPVSVACVLVQPDLLAGDEIRMELSGSLGHYTGSEWQPILKPFGSIVGRGKDLLLIMRNRSIEGKYGEIQFTEEVSCLGSCLASRLECLQKIVQPLKYSPLLHKLTNLRMNISRYTGVRPVALKAVEIWGTLSTACSAEEQEAARKAIGSLKAQPTSSGPAESLDVYNTQRICPPEMQLAGHSLAPLLISANELPTQPSPNFVHNPGGHPSHLRMEETEHMGGLAEGAFQLAAPCTLALTRNPAKMQSKMIKKKPHWSEEPLGGTFSSGRESGVGFSEKNPPEAPTSNPSSAHRKTSSLRMEPAANIFVTQDSNSGSNKSSNSKAVSLTPERFLDEITYDIMAIPMLLPSGHYVDRSTLDRVVQSDVSYGRSPSDPFTGVPFTSTIKPQFCAQLKSQIDQLLSAEENVFAGQGRTLGSASDITQHLRQQAASLKRPPLPVASEDSGSKRPRCSLKSESETREPVLSPAPPLLVHCSCYYVLQPFCSCNCIIAASYCCSLSRQNTL